MRCRSSCAKPTAEILGRNGEPSQRHRRRPLDSLFKLIDDLEEGRRGLKDDADSIVRYIEEAEVSLRPMREAHVSAALSSCEGLLKHLREVKST